MLRTPTFSPATRARLVTLELNALSLIAPFPFLVTTAGLFTRPVNVTPIPASVGSSAPYTLLWFAIAPVRLAWLIVNVGRSEERRVGKEGRAARNTQPLKKRTPTFSPATRARIVTLELSAVSWIAAFPSPVPTAGLFTRPVNVTPIPASVGSSAPYTLLWFAIAPVRLAWLIVNVGEPVKLGAL